MTDPIPATPGWVDEKLDAMFASLSAEARGARDAFAACLARAKAPAAPSDLLGAEFEPCHAGLRRGLVTARIDSAAIDRVLREAEALEAEIAAES